MNTYPADEKRIAEVERGRSCDAVVPLPPGGSLAAGDAILFAISQSRPGQKPTFVSWGDSVLVSLTDVVALDKTDPATGHALFHVHWKPLGQDRPTVPTARRAR
jgi:hypothetical protein